MPSFRGIDISIHAPSEIGKLPEYPHPDASAVQLATLCGHQKDPSLVSKSNPTISVYIPSVPGVQFCINYAVQQKPDPPSHLFFKLFMNGRHITSWGINPQLKQKGRVEKALYEPSDRWGHEEDGATVKPEGIEARYFHFIGGEQEKSVAEDGGLIEVQVFRAKSRRRRAARLDQYRHQEKYGIAAPSGGLLDNPQDVTFFDFHLIDPKDEPYASFRFHYRSQANLRQLNLIPPDDSSIFDTFSASTFTDSIDLSPDASLDDTQSEKGPAQSPMVRPDPDESVFNDSSSSGGQPELGQGRGPIREKLFVLRTPPYLRPGSGTTDHLPQPSKTLRDGSTDGIPVSYLQRPLPDRPLPELPVGVPNELCGPSRKTSTTSIATSLLSYVRDGSFLDESVEYGHAQEVPVYKARSDACPPYSRQQPSPDGWPVSDYEKYLSPGDDLEAGQSELDSPGRQAADKIIGSKDNSDFRSIDDGLPPVKDNEILSPKACESVGNIREKYIDFSRFPHLQLDEHEWIRRLPSPKARPRRALSPTLGRLWDTLRRNRSRSPPGRPLREAPIRNHSTPHLSGRDGDEKYGNWI